MTMEAFEALSAKATKCRVCFERFDIKAALIDVAQPRWVGNKYWSAHPRVVVVMLNPGSGEARDRSADTRSLDLLKAFAQGRGSLAAIMSHQAGDMPNWGRQLRTEDGKPNGHQFTAFYLKGLNLKLDEIAFANVAWCATSGNKYPACMLSTCFERHTQPLLALLAPDVVLLSGSAAHRFAASIKRDVPGAKVVPMMHYAHREGASIEATELSRVRTQL
jgi:uracil-DNA glycosylase